MDLHTQEEDAEVMAEEVELIVSPIGELEEDTMGVGRLGDAKREGEASTLDDALPESSVFDGEGGDCRREEGLE